MLSLDRAWRVLCALTAHKPAHGHGHCHAHLDPDFFFATEVTPGPLLSVQYTHIKRPPNSRCAICSGFEDTTKMRAHSRGTCQADLAADRRKEQRTELTKWNSLTEDTPRDAVTNALRLHLHNFAYKTFKIKCHDHAFRPVHQRPPLAFQFGSLTTKEGHRHPRNSRSNRQARQVGRTSPRSFSLRKWKPQKCGPPAEDAS